MLNMKKLTDTISTKSLGMNIQQLPHTQILVYSVQVVVC